MYNNNRILAIGDIHADYEIFVNILLNVKIINKKGEWICGDTYVVQLGDILDGKRPNVNTNKDFIESAGEVKICKLIIKLDKLAKEHGGRFISILGNHELYPYYFYNDKNFENDYVKDVDIKDYKKRYNMSRFQYYKPGKGPGAKKLGLTRPFMLQLGSVIFTHGSLNVKFLELCKKNNMTNSNGKYVSIQKVNKSVSEWMTGESNKIPFFINESDSINPLFNRELTDPRQMNKKDCKNIVSKILSYFQDAHYLVMGHSTHKHINSICENRVIRTDLGISRAFGNDLEKNIKRIEVLEILQYKNKTKINVIDSNGKHELKTQ
jgi:hypothetical protein